jgi:hypothetical protein
MALLKDNGYCGKRSEMKPTEMDRMAASAYRCSP